MDPRIVFAKLKATELELLTMLATNKKQIYEGGQLIYGRSDFIKKVDEIHKLAEELANDK
jgi:hypothetical protein